MRKKIIGVFTAGMLFASAACCPVHAAGVSAVSALVLEPFTDTVLYEQDADRRMLVASTTKIMTAMVVLEHCSLSELVEITPAHAAVEGSSMYLRPGEDYTVEELLYGLLLASGNDAAAALADHCAGSMEAFAALMNEKCTELELQNTHFANSHGLDAEDHYSTARDLAHITAAAMEIPAFCEMFSTQSKTIHGITYINHNKLLGSCPGCIGGKTGYTEAAGRILVSCVEREGMRLICVTISDPSDWEDHAALYDAIFSAWQFIPLPGERWQCLETISGTQNAVRLMSDSPGIVTPKDTNVHLVARLPRFVFAPVLAGTAAGEIELWGNDSLLSKIPVYYGETVPMDSSLSISAWERFRRLWFLSGGIYYLTEAAGRAAAYGKGIA